MATKKDKYLENAQKFILKGQIDRAIREYEQIVALDPKDIKNRQKLAELLVRSNRRDDSLREYEVIGKFFADNGFYLKAIAVYKQIQKIDPSDLNIPLTLAALNEKQGLVGNALAEYKVVFDHFEKSGRLADAVGVLEKMLAADKENVAIKLKLAETRSKAGMADAAYQDFLALAMDMKAKGDISSFNQVCTRIQVLFPDKIDFLREMAESELRSGNPHGALPILKQLLKGDESSVPLLELLAEAYNAAGEHEGTKRAYARILQIAPDNDLALHGLFNCALKQKNIDDGLRLLQTYADRFSSSGADGLETHYRQLQDLFPADERISDVLAELVPAPPETVTPVPESVETAASWDEEIDLEFPDDDLTFDREDLAEADSSENTAVFAELPPLEIEQTAAVEVSTSYTDELELESDADDTLLSFESLETADSSPFAGEYDSMEQVELEIDDTFSASDEWISESVLSGDDVELTIETDFSDESNASAFQSEDDFPLGGDFSLDDALDALDSAVSSSPASTPQELLSEGEPASTESVPVDEPTNKDKYSLAGFFSEFKKGVDQQLDQGDTETHYNLGIAYKEMGLYDDAITEFRVAAADPQRRFDCLTLQGMCYRDKGDFEAAEELIRTGMALSELSDDEMLGLKYEMAMVYEGAGRSDEALELYREIHQADSYFRDTIQKIARLQQDDSGVVLDDLDLIDLELEEVE